MVGRGKIILQKSRVDISFFTGILDNLDNIRWNIARFVEGAPRYMLECEGLAQRLATASEDRQTAQPASA